MPQPRLGRRSVGKALRIRTRPRKQIYAPAGAGFVDRQVGKVRLDRKRKLPMKQKREIPRFIPLLEYDHARNSELEAGPIFQPHGSQPVLVPHQRLLDEAPSTRSSGVSAFSPACSSSAPTDKSGRSTPPERPGLTPTKESSFTSSCSWPSTATPGAPNFHATRCGTTPRGPDSLPLCGQFRQAYSAQTVSNRLDPTPGGRSLGIHPAHP